MDFIFFSILLLSLAVWAWILNTYRKPAKLPPGPKPFPIIGNVLELGEKPHQSLAKLSQIYGPLMHLKLGSLTTIVVSSPEIAKIILQKHDLVFSNRKPLAAAQALDHHKRSIGWLPVDDQWRKLRRICKEQMFSVPSLDSGQGLRREKLQKLCDYVRERCRSGEAVEIERAAFVTSLNLMSATLVSQEFGGFDSDASQEIRDAVLGVMEMIGKPNLADYFPVLGFIDPQGIRRKAEVYFQRCLDNFTVIIEQRLKSRAESIEIDRKDDMLEVLLDLNLKKESELSIQDMLHLLLDLFIAGTDTTSSTVEWALSELLRQPEKMQKTKTELKHIVGSNEQVRESDIAKLPYLRAVVKETFRLHPTVPLLIPHTAGQDMKINGFTIPKNAQILVNGWAIGRDSSIWPNPDSFLPERFLESRTDFKGQHFELIPFSAGRRICPGLPLANRMVHMMVATLVHNFDWKLDGGIAPQELDMAEHFGLALHKATHLRAIAVGL